MDIYISMYNDKQLFSMIDSDTYIYQGEIKTRKERGDVAELNFRCDSQRRPC